MWCQTRTCRAEGGSSDAPSRPDSSSSGGTSSLHAGTPPAFSPSGLTAALAATRAGSGGSGSPRDGSASPSPPRAASPTLTPRGGAGRRRSSAMHAQAVKASLVNQSLAIATLEPFADDGEGLLRLSQDGGMLPDTPATPKSPLQMRMDSPLLRASLDGSLSARGRGSVGGGAADGPEVRRIADRAVDSCAWLPQALICLL